MINWITDCWIQDAMAYLVGDKCPNFKIKYTSTRGQIHLPWQYSGIWSKLILLFRIQPFTFFHSISLKGLRHLFSECDIQLSTSGEQFSKNTESKMKIKVNKKKIT